MSVDTRAKLLIVEDDEGLQRQLRWAYDDYEVLVASDRDAAVNLVRATEPAVVTLDLGLPPDPDGVSEGFAALEQALVHIVQNAIDASADGLPVEVRGFESGGDVAIEVVDRGPGMSEEFIRTRLFQPFASTKESGFGIGAYEARALIQAMGGRLDVESAAGEGARFTIILPAAEAPSILPYERMRA